MISLNQHVNEFDANSQIKLLEMGSDSERIILIYASEVVADDGGSAVKKRSRLQALFLIFIQQHKNLLTDVRLNKCQAKY